MCQLRGSCLHARGSVPPGMQWPACAGTGFSECKVSLADTHAADSSPVELVKQQAQLLWPPSSEAATSMPMHALAAPKTRSRRRRAAAGAALASVCCSHLHGLAQAHFVGKDQIGAALPALIHPIQALQLQSTHSKLVDNQSGQLASHTCTDSERQPCRLATVLQAQVRRSE